MKRFSLLLFFTVLWLNQSVASLKQETLDYTDEQGALLEGYLVYDDAMSKPQPGVVVIHDWRGLTDTTRHRADMLANLGYVAFAADVYGKGVHPQSIPEYGKLATLYKGNRPLFRERERAAYTTLLKQPQVDPNRIAAIGYCFGGTGVIEMARDGLNLKGVVSFHGGLDSASVEEGHSIKAKVLALCGADDPFEAPADFAAFEQELRANNIDYQIVKYGHAVHAFSDAGVDALQLPGAKYNAEADRRSWQAMRDFFNEIFGKS